MEADILSSKRLVVLVGSQRAIARAVKNDQVQGRNTGLVTRLRVAFAEPSA